jgi:hypothetical protein
MNDNIGTRMPGRGSSEQFKTEYGAISEAQKGTNICLCIIVLVVYVAIKSS